MFSENRSGPHRLMGRLKRGVSELDPNANLLQVLLRLPTFTNKQVKASSILRNALLITFTNIEQALFHVLA